MNEWRTAHKAKNRSKRETGIVCRRLGQGVPYTGLLNSNASGCGRRNDKERKCGTAVKQ